MNEMESDKVNLPISPSMVFKETKLYLSPASKSISTPQNIDKYDPLLFCRTCANMDPCLVPIFKGEGLDHNLIKKIEKYLPIQVSEEDDLPLHLCYQCASTLIAWDTLILGCLEAEKKLNFLKNSLADKQSEDISVKDIDNVEALSSDNLDESDDEPLSYKKDNDNLEQNEKEDILEEKNLESEKKSLESSVSDSERLLEEPVLSFTAYQHQFTLRRPFVAEIFSLKIDNFCCCNICTMIEKIKFNYLKSLTLAKLKNKTSENTIIESKCDDSGVSDPCLEKSKKRKQIRSKCCVFCDNCGKTFSSKLSLLNHMKVHINNKTFDCRECGKVFRYRFNLVRHLRVIHEGVRKHVCQDCGKSYRSRGEMEDHQNIHNCKQKIICEECGRIFLTKASFYAHKKYHRGKTIVKEKKKFTCEKCNKMFTTKKSKTQHMLIHTGEKPIVCTVCGKNFRTKANFSQHEKVHSNVKPHTCEHCGKAFARKDHLTIHIRSHTGEKPFICSTCGRGFAQMNDMKKHLKIHERNR